MTSYSNYMLHRKWSHAIVTKIEITVLLVRTCKRKKYSVLQLTFMACS